MKKCFLYLLAAFMLFPSASKAQGTKAAADVKTFEFEVRLNPALPLSCRNGESADLTLGFGLEGRWNLQRLPMDVGVAVNSSGAYRSGWEYGTLALMGVTDWNFNRGGKVSPYVGLGLGVGVLNSNAFDEDDSQAAFVAMPRVGVELFRHVRIGLSLNLSKSRFNNAALSVGYAFGGGLRKK